MQTHRFLPIILMASLGMAACGSDGDRGAGGSVTPEPTLPAASAPGPDASNEAGDPSGAWVLVDGPTEPIAGWDVTVEIEGDRIGGTAACNGYGGNVEIGDGTIDVGEFFVTEMGCRSDVQELEQAFLSSLTAATEFAVVDGGLELVAPDGVWRFDRLPPIPTAELVGVTWRLDGYLDGDAVSTEPAMDDAFIELSADGTVVGATNCRRLTGSWVETGGEVVFTSFGADGECPDEAAWDLDSRIVTVLGDGFRPEIDGDRLTVMSQGDVGLTFRTTD